MLHHLEINVSNLEQSIKFWGELLERLGYESYQTWETGRSWKAGNTYLVFVQAEAAFLEHPFHRKQVGINHLAFQVDTPQEVDQFVEWLTERKIPLLYMDNYPYAGGPKHYAVYFEDPDKIKVEIVAANES